MRYLLFISTIFSLSLQAQTSIGSKSYKTAAGVTNADTSVNFRAGGYADYPVKADKDGIYKFNLRAINYSAKSSAAYIWSPATGVWANAAMVVSKAYQNIPIKVTLNTTTTYVRLYFVDSATIDGMTYMLDSPFGVDLTPLQNRVTALEGRLTDMQKVIDSLSPLYIQGDYGTRKDNPIKP